MYRTYKYRDSITDGTKGILRRLFVILTTWSKVTVLLFIFIIAVPGAVRADGMSRTDVRLFEFTSESYMLTGTGRLYGLMASDGSRHRIAIYWIEPAAYHDSSFFLGYSDYIFEEDVVRYWIHGVSKPGTFDLTVNESDTLLPRDTSTESVARSALAIANRTRSEPEQGHAALEVGKFFRQSRDRTDYSYEVLSEQSSSNATSVSSASDVQILNTLPFGRRYSKEMQSDGATVWRAQRVLEGPHIARVTVKPIPRAQMDDAGAMFNPDTLGQWALIPEPYRAYWSFDRSYSELKDEPDDGVHGRKLHDGIETYLNKNKVPERTDVAFNQLLFKTRLFLIDLDAVRSTHWISRRRRIKNLDELGRNFLDLKIVSTSDRARFLKNYLEIYHREKKSFKYLFRDVSQRTTRRLVKHGQRFTT